MLSSGPAGNFRHRRPNRYPAEMQGSPRRYCNRKCHCVVSELKKKVPYEVARQPAHDYTHLRAGARQILSISALGFSFGDKNNMVKRYCKYLLKHLTVKKQVVLTSVSVKTDIFGEKNNGR
jgi:hypothetical protein